MIIKRLKKYLLAAGGAAFSLAAGLRAEATLPAADGDVFLCFRASGGLGANIGYMVNLGSVTQFTGASGVVTVDLGEVQGGSIATDLENTYGADWNTRSDVLWSVSGGQKVTDGNLPNNTMFVSAAESAPGTQSTPWNSPSAFGASSPALMMQSMRTAYTDGTTADQSESTMSTKALIQGQTATNSYVSYMPGGANSTGSSAFRTFNRANGIESTFANGTAQSVVDLYKLVPASGTGVLVGGFKLSDSAQLTFSPTIAYFQGPANVHFQVASESVSESVVGGKITLTVVREGNTNTAFSLNFSTTDDTAKAGTDFTGQNNTVISFGAGETSKTVDVLITDRPGYQGDRAFSASFALATGTATLINPSTETITIQESTQQPALLSLNSATYSVNEGTANATITVNRGGVTTSAVTAEISTTDGAAKAGDDYTAQANVQVSFAANETTKDVLIPIADRSGYQGDRAFTVTLANPSASGQINSPSQATVTIVESAPNPAGAFAFSNAAYQVGVTAGSVDLTVNRTLGVSGAVDVDVVVNGGSLTAGEDFTFSTTTLHFLDQQASATVNVPINPAAAPVPGTMIFNLTNATNGASVGAQGSTTVTVTKPDTILPKLVVTTPKAGATGSAISVQGTVSDADNIARVTVQLNGVSQDATLDTPANGTTPFHLTLNAENGPNTLVIQAFDSKGTPSKALKIALNYVNVREVLAGTYTGLITPNGNTPPADNVNNASGFFTANVTKTGSFTGKVLIGGATLPFGGVIANDQTARFKTAFGSTLSLVIKGRVPLTLGNLSFGIDNVTGDIEGTIGDFATIHAERSAFDGKTPATTVPAAYLGVNNATGKFTSAILSKANAGLQSDDFPQGDGVGNVTIAKNGAFTFKGKLADGTPMTVSGALSSNLTAPLYLPLYAKKGSFAGVVSLDNSADDTDFTATDCLWLRPEQATSKYYPGGWTDGILVDLIGAKYSVTPGTSVLPHLGATDVNLGNADLTAEDGNVNGQETISFNIATTNKVTNVPVTDKTVSLTLTAPTGAFSGFFTHNVDNTKTKYAGVILQKGANPAGYGFFLTNVPKGGTNGESGHISLSAK